MLPQILQQLAGASPLAGNLSQLKSMMQMVRNAGNPAAMMQNMAQNNPQMRQVMDMVQQAGGNPQKAFYAACEQRGINPQQIIDALK